MPITTPSGSVPIEYQLGDAELKDYDFSPIAPMEGVSLDDIWNYDGSGDADTRPDFVKADDATIAKG